MKFLKKKRKIMIIVIIIVLILIACDMRLKTVVYNIESDKVSKTVRLALISDLHSDWYGKEQKNLCNAVGESNPDIVLLCGDIFDDKKSYDNAKTALEALSKKYPCYYVTGNHEYWGDDIDNILSIVSSYDIKILSGECDTIDINGEKINICGVDDPDAYEKKKQKSAVIEQIEDIMAVVDKDYYTVLLSHRPELIEVYKEYDFDLVLSGHAHGGQWRIPGILNGVYVPHQGIFPKYSGGRYDYENGSLIISRGLARESTPIPRIFNRPELVIIEIK